MSTWIKFCAQTNLADSLASYAAGADAVGFVFAESKRRVTPAQVKEIVSKLPAAGEKIGVFVNERPENIAHIVLETGLTGVQLHGQESLDQLRELRSLLPHRVTLTKTLHAGQANAEITEFADSSEVADAFLIDSGGKKNMGGTGETFDWQQMKPYVDELRKSARVMIAGGLHPHNVADAIRLFHPFGVDVASGIENAPGKKDLEKMHTFVQAVRSADAQTARAI